MHLAFMSPMTSYEQLDFSGRFSLPLTVYNDLNWCRNCCEIRAGGRTPVPPGRGGTRICQGPHVTLRMKFFLVYFNVFKIFVKMKSTGSVVI